MSDVTGHHGQDPGPWLVSVHLLTIIPLSLSSLAAQSDPGQTWPSYVNCSSRLSRPGWKCVRRWVLTIPSLHTVTCCHSDTGPGLTLTPHMSHMTLSKFQRMWNYFTVISFLSVLSLPSSYLACHKKWMVVLLFWLVLCLLFSWPGLLSLRSHHDTLLVWRSLGCCCSG